MTLTSGTPWYIDPALQPAPRWGYGLQLGTAWYDALGSGEVFGSVGFTLTRTGPTNWTVTFVGPALNTPPLSLAQCYVFSPSLEVRTITPVLNGLGQITAVNLVTSEQGPFTYTLTIYGTERA